MKMDTYTGYMTCNVHVWEFWGWSIIISVTPSHLPQLSMTTPIPPPSYHKKSGLLYYDYHLSKARWALGDQVLTFNLCCCHGQLAPFPVAPCQPLMSLTAKHEKLQVTILLLPLETMEVASGNIIILSPKPRHQSSVAPYSTDNHSDCCLGEILGMLPSDHNSEPCVLSKRCVVTETNRLFFVKFTVFLHCVFVIQAYREDNQ